MHTIAKKIILRLTKTCKFILRLAKGNVWINLERVVGTERVIRKYSVCVCIARRILFLAREKTILSWNTSVLNTSA